MKTPQQPEKPSVIAFKRKKTVSKAVLIADKAADRVITIGGILVIVAVLGILVFLVSETLPLFTGGKVTAEHEYVLETAPKDVLLMTIDEYKTMSFLLYEDGTIYLHHARSGTPLIPPQLDFAGKEITAFAHTIDRAHFACGFGDGTVQLGTVQFMTDIVTAADLPSNLQEIDERDSTDGTIVYSKIPGDQFRKVWIEMRVEDPLEVTDANKSVITMDYRVSGQAERQLKTFVVVDDEGQVTLNLAQSKLNMMTGKVKTTLKRIQLPALPQEVCDKIHTVLLTESADTVFIADSDGTVYRYNTRDVKAPVLAEISSVLPKGVKLTAFDFLLGGKSIVVAGSDTSLSIFFLLKREDSDTQDKQVLTKTRSFPAMSSPATLFSQSNRGKSFALAHDNGDVQVFHGTSQKLLAKFSADSETTTDYRKILLTPRFDGVMTVQDNNRVRLWEFEVPHPETTFRTLFQKVWYEGYAEPTFTWQSSAATDDFESKFSLIPLVFGTVKAAFYSLLFAIPISILGAIYTSEFLDLRVRGVVKPIMEMMASLPSVVLGFVAALVLAPIVETWIAAVLLAFVALPVALMISAFLWQLLPFHLSNRWRGVPKFSLMIVVVLLAVLFTYQVGLLFEAFFFGGDFKAWLSGTGDTKPFLFLLLLPVSFTLIAALVTRFFGNRIGKYMLGISPFKAALFDIGKWCAMVVATIICAYGIAHLLNALGIDARGSFVGTYVQRNTLIVGFAMGFAVIPIIYTIAEDALNAVPQHLRAASLGCGATPWQTAIYVILPTALSGVFSAMMIGMGRAVGETMIVVMAAGNTPLLDWNLFNGLRALSATIAVELPEAVKDGTLYRILFLSGLVLFGMTFIINTIAEVVRIRFRKRASQL